MKLEEHICKKKKKKKKIFIINFLVTNFRKQRMVECCVELILNNESNDLTEWNF
jgi:hypothetical protein